MGRERSGGSWSVGRGGSGGSWSVGRGVRWLVVCGEREIGGWSERDQVAHGL